MGNNLTSFEGGIKSALQGFEMPYEPSAWDDLEKRLDGGSSSSSSSNLTFIMVAASIAIVVGLFAYFNLSSTGNEGLMASQSVQIKEPLNFGRFSKSLQNSASTSFSSENNNLGTEELVFTGSTESDLGTSQPVHSQETSNYEENQSATNKNLATNTGETTSVTSDDTGESSNGVTADIENSEENSDEVVFASSIQEACVGVEIDFDLTKGAIEGSFLWNFGDGDFSSQANPSHVYNKPGVYDISLSVRSKDDGQIRSKVVKNLITINPIPEASFDWEFEKEPSAVPRVSFTNASERASNCEWLFDGKVGSTEINPKYSFVDGGKHEVVLTVTNEYGCVDEYVDYIFVDDDYNLNAPLSFTPNGDGKQDFFMPSDLIGSEFTFKLTVYDNMQPVYETTAFTKPWDGTIDGTLAPAGVYPWVVLIYNNRGEEERYFSGIVTITP